jgi:hypothetical protein
LDIGIRQSKIALNYFNYFTEIEDAFVRRRGKHLFLSPMDWALMETWKEQDIPLHIVLRGIERSFDSFEAKPRKRSVKSLLYCQEEVEAQFAEWLESRVGANPSEQNETQTKETNFSEVAVRDHLTHCRRTLADLATSRSKTKVDQLTEALSRSVSLLEQIENDLESGTRLDTRRLEDSLTGLERMLNESLLLSFSDEELKPIHSELKDQLKPYRKEMQPKDYEQMFNNFLLKKLRDKEGVPRLSLFYL